jgi:hypothetical protein
MSNFNCFTPNGVSIVLNDLADYHAHHCYEYKSFNTVQYVKDEVYHLLGLNRDIKFKATSESILSLNLKGRYRDLQHFAKVLGAPATLPARDLAFILLSID